MKNIGKYLLFTLVMAAFAACSETPSEDALAGGNSASENLITVTAQSDATRTTLASDGSVNWHKSDIIALYDAAGVPIAFSSTLEVDNVAVSDFEGVDPEKEGVVYSSYPYSRALSADYSAKTLNFTFSRGQTAATYGDMKSASFAMNSYPSIGVAADGENFTFKNLFGAYRFYFTGTDEVSNITITSSSESALYGEVEVDMADFESDPSANRPVVKSITGGGDSVSYAFSSNVQLDATTPTAFLVILPPTQDPDSFEYIVTVTFNDNASHTWSAALNSNGANNEIVANTITEIGSAAAGVAIAPSDVVVEYGTPTISGVMKSGVANSDVVLSIPYRYGTGSAVNISVASSDSAITATLQDSYHVYGNLDYTESVDFLLSGTPSSSDDLTFTITYNDTTGTSGTVTEVKANVYAADGTLSLMDGSIKLGASYDCVLASESASKTVGSVSFTDYDITMDVAPYATTAAPQWSAYLLRLDQRVQNIDGVVDPQYYWTFKIPISTEVKSGSSIYFDADLWNTQKKLDYTIHNLHIHYSTDNSTWSNSGVASSGSKDPADDGKTYIPVGHRVTDAIYGLNTAGVDDIYDDENSPVTFSINIDNTNELQYGDILYIRMYITGPAALATADYGFANYLTIKVE